MTTVEDALSGPDRSAARRASRVAVHTFRPRRSWPALIVGALVLGIAALAAVEVAAALAGAPMSPAVTSAAGAYTAEARWSDPVVRIASAVAAGIGLVLIALALVPGRGRFTALRTGDPELVVGLSRSGLKRTLAAAAHDVGGVRGAHVSVGRRRIRVRVRTDLREAPELRGEVAAAVRQRLTELEPVYGFTVTTRVRYTKA
ncbi:alkaline shock response membrane anchor protein AmaP [Streptomonospora sp. PA3]|uniref:DUF6286 domain-containing protein n=1 Tax=Streptomonospora sp. PA3 TaxID=2607326 RepID=UPI0012DDAF9A|nr:DUF6286 domain-containing protein [Streptomonospora sp. PA3]MUL39927.1 alkaline shock response membrane anchor protein AmaP [Streptomonospora sp. PA3]